MEQVTVSPTWSEAWHYANLTGQWLWTALGIIFLIVSVLILVLSLLDKLPDFLDRVAKMVSFLWIATALVGASCLLIKPGAIWLNNDKHVDKTYLEQVGHKYILDSCFKNNLMVNAAVK